MVNIYKNFGIYVQTIYAYIVIVCMCMYVVSNEKTHLKVLNCLIIVVNLSAMRNDGRKKISYFSLKILLYSGDVLLLE